MPKKKPIILSRKSTKTAAGKRPARTKQAANKMAKSPKRKPRATAKAKVPASHKRTAARAKKAAPRSVTKRATKRTSGRQSPARKAKSSKTAGAHLRRTQPRRPKHRPGSGLRSVPPPKRETVEIIEALEIGPGVFAVNEYEVEDEGVTTPGKSGNETV